MDSMKGWIGYLPKLRRDMQYASMLTDMILDGQWQVLEKLTKKSSTGGHFSTGYKVRNIKTGTGAFLKASDFSEAFDTDDLRSIPRTLERLTNAYNFEKQLCELCRGYSMDRVVHAIASGTIRTNESDRHSIVNYLIFELADGDVRGHIETGEAFDNAFALRTLHCIANALQQLHSRGIAHQDIKPSNVLIFTQQRNAKIADLGKAYHKDVPAPHDSKDIPGDSTYAPPEFYYRGLIQDENQKRFGSDIYYFGSLIVYIFTGSYMNALLNKHLSSEHRYHRWAGTFEEALPFLMEAFSKALQEIDSQIPSHFKPKLTLMIEQLCDPDPRKRGHPLNRVDGGNPHSLERYLSTLNYLSFLAETTFLKRD